MQDSRYTFPYEYPGLRIMVVEAETCDEVAYWPLTDTRDVWVEANGLTPGKYWVLVESDWDGKKCLSSETDRGSGREFLPVGVSVRHEPSATVELLAPVHCKLLDGVAIKALAFRHICEKRAKPMDIVTYSSMDGLSDVPGTEFIRRSYVDFRDTYIWLYRNASKSLRITETVQFSLNNLMIEGQNPKETKVVVTIAPGETQLVVLKQARCQCRPTFMRHGMPVRGLLAVSLLAWQVKAGVMVQWSSEPDVELEDIIVQDDSGTASTAAA